MAKVLILLALVLTAYFNSLRNPFLVDDIAGIVNNPNIKNIEHTWQYGHTFLRPLIYYVTYKIWGLNSAAFRMVNIIAHFGVVTLVYFFFAKISSKKTGFITAALFAVHPLLTESVAWISGGSYPLYSLFFLLTLICYYKYTEPKNKRKLWGALSLSSFILSIMFSEKALILPLVVLLLNFVYFKQVARSKFILGSYFLIALLFFVLSLKGVPNKIIAVKSFGESAAYYNPLVQIPVAITTYLQLIVWPANLSLYYASPLTNLEYVIRVIGLLCFITSLVFFYKKNKNIFFGGSIFLISLLPTLTPLPLASMIAERYIYLGTIGILFALVVFFEEYFLQWLKQIGMVLLILIVVLLSIRTMNRNNDWGDEERFWHSTLKSSDYVFQAHYNLAQLYLKKGDTVKAIDEFTKTIRLQPQFAFAHYDLGVEYHKQGKLQLALSEYLQTIKLKRDHWNAYQNISGIYFQIKEYDQSLKYLKKAINFNPQNASLYNNLGIIYLAKNQKIKAKEAFLQALKLDPRNKNAKRGLTMVL